MGHAEFLQSAVVILFASIDDALEALELGGYADESFGGIAALPFGVLGEVGVGGVLPENGFDAAHAAETPFVVNERIDEFTLGGIGRSVVLVILGGEFGEIFGVFVEHDLLFGVDAVLKGVETGFGFCLGGGGLLCGCHGKVLSTKP